MVQTGTAQPQGSPITGAGKAALACAATSAAVSLVGLLLETPGQCRGDYTFVAWFVLGPVAVAGGLAGLVLGGLGWKSPAEGGKRPWVSTLVMAVSGATLAAPLLLRPLYCHALRALLGG